MITIQGGEIIKSGTKLFHDLNWQLNTGDHWVISGPNGSGKTTLLELLAGTRHLTKGEIHYDFISEGTWDERHAEKKRKIKYIPAHAIQSFLSSSHELYYQQRYYDIGDERTPLVKDILGNNIQAISSLHIPDSLSINQLLELEITRLSNGQLKKLLLVKSLLEGIPNMLLLDYPFEGLDIASRKDLCQFIDHLCVTYSITIIVTDHGHHLPAVINKRLLLDNFAIIREQPVLPVSDNYHPIVSESIHSSSVRADEVIRINNLTIQYGNKVVLNQFNWIVSKGERWALVGKNGAGKTTLFSLIFADHPMAYSQQIYLFGKRRGTGESIWDIKKRINYLGPELISYLNPQSILLTGMEYLKSINRKWNDDAYQHLADFFQARQLLTKRIQHMSSGELQLTLIINCFLTEKELLLLDEPFQFLDTACKQRVRDYIHQHLHPDSTLVLITHYSHEVSEWAHLIKQL